MKTQASHPNAFGGCLYLAFLTALLSVVMAQPGHAQQKPGWSVVFDEEFNENNVDDLFGPTGLWCSEAGCWDPHGWGLAYQSPVPAWTNLPPGCQQPTINTALTGAGTLTLTARKNPGNYAVYEFPQANVYKGSRIIYLPGGVKNLGVGNPIADSRGAIPYGTTITAVNWPWTNDVQLSNAATASYNEDMLSVMSCVPYQYTGAALFSKNTFLYGYFEMRARIPQRGQFTWPAFWFWNGGGETYREVDVFEFGTKNILDNILMNVHLAGNLDGGPAGSSGVNNYPDSYVYISPDGISDLSDDFHTYGLKWTPNILIWYLDGQPIRTLGGHTPHLDMYLLADIDIQPWIVTPNFVLPANYEINYVRGYKSQSKEFLWYWGNGGSRQIHWWNMNPTDRYLSGKFQGNGRAQLLAIAENKWGWAQMMNFNGSSWDTTWGNDGSHKIHWWDINSADKYVVGDFLGNGRDQLLALNDGNGWSQLMSYDNSLANWDTPWGNSGSGKIAWWNMNKEDQYIAGDFAGLGYDQLLAVDYADGWAQLIAYYGGSWHTIWGNNGSGAIGGWNISPGDHFFSGDFDGKGRKQLMAIATNRWQYAELLQFSSGIWNGVWSNNGSGKIHWWNMNPSDQYFVGNFDGGEQDELLAVSTGGWAELMSYSGPDWDAPWSNDGGGTIDLWYMHLGDKYAAGDFNARGRDDLFVAALNGWAQLMDRQLP